MQTPADLIGTREAARILDVNPATISRWVADGTLTIAHKLPGKSGAFVFDRTVIEERAALQDRTPAAS